MDAVPRKRVQLISIPDGVHFLTFSCFQRQPLLANLHAYADLCHAIQSTRERQPFHLWAYVFMPEHVHLLLWLPGEQLSISDILRSIKQSSARHILNRLRKLNPAALAMLETGQPKTPYRFWQQGPGFDRNLDNGRALREVVHYIHENPVRRGLSKDSIDYVWSSCRSWELSEDKPLHIDKDSFPSY